MRRHVVFLVFFMMTLNAWAAEEPEAKGLKFTGNVKLLSHFVENGLSQSDNSPALQGTFLYNLGSQFRFGLWASNTYYSSREDHFNLRANADIKANFTQTSYLLISIIQSQYYNTGMRNGSITDLNIVISNFKFIYRSTGNWEGTEDIATRIGGAYNRSVNIAGAWKWNTEVGYNMPAIKAKIAYFDIATGLERAFGELLVEGALTATSESSQFTGSGDPFFILSIKREF